MLDYMPVQATSWASQVDWINNLINYISVFCTLGITGVMLFFAVRYRRRDEPTETPYITHNTGLETVWTVIPSIIVMGVFYYGFTVYREMRTPPANAMEINVKAFSWRWEFSYPNGRKSTKTLVVPLGKPVRLIMTSERVIHSFFIPAMRVKEDVYAGNYSYLWFTPTKLGDFHIFCAEYCGRGHSDMRGVLRVVTPEQFEDFLLERKEADAPVLTPAEQGKQLFEIKACLGCHSVDGSAMVGPSLQGIFAKKERQLASGEMVPIDENYIRESILNPEAKIAAGFEKIPMPAFAGQLNDEELQALIAYLKSL